MSVRDFYDGLASDYHLIYADWDAAVDRQATALEDVIRKDHGAQAVSVLDCSCGIGTQAIGLARRGYTVHATDISSHSIERAEREAARLDAPVTFGVADFRDLEDVPGTFDVVLSCDNALPHLLTDGDLHTALVAMKQKLRPGGLLLVSVRDYDEMIIDRQQVSMPRLIAGPPRRLIVYLHDWDADDQLLYTLHLFVAVEADDDWSVIRHHTRYRALTEEALGRAVTDAGFSDLIWRTADEAAFHQPVLTARNRCRNHRSGWPEQITAL